MSQKSPFATEAALHGAVATFLSRLQIPHTNQHPVGDGFADVCMELPNGQPWGLLELKNGLRAEQLLLSDAADFFEQALKYRLASGLPVFVGPFFHENMGVISGLLGDKPNALSALSALGGRADIGLLFLHAIKGYEGRQEGWYGFQMVLRQQRIASHHIGQYTETLWPAEPIAMVGLETAGSRKDRR